jgi:hypothetical protein
VQEKGKTSDEEKVLGMEHQNFVEEVETAWQGEHHLAKRALWERELDRGRHHAEKAQEKRVPGDQLGLGFRSWAPSLR